MNNASRIPDHKNKRYLPMKKSYTSEFHGKSQMQKDLSRLSPKKSTLNLIRQFARVYTVAKIENGKTVDLFIN